MKKRIFLALTLGIVLSSCASNTIVPREDLWKHVAEVNRDLGTSSFEVIDSYNRPFTAKRLLTNDHNVVSWADDLDSTHLMAEARGLNYNYRMGGAVQGGIVGVGVGLAGFLYVVATSKTGKVSETPDIANLLEVTSIVPLSALFGFGIGYLIGQPVHYTFSE